MAPYCAAAAAGKKPAAGGNNQTALVQGLVALLLQHRYEYQMLCCFLHTTSRTVDAPGTLRGYLLCLLLLLVVQSTARTSWEVAPRCYNYSKPTQDAFAPCTQQQQQTHLDEMQKKKNSAAAPYLRSPEH